MDGGRYRTCERCGRPVDVARGVALPYARLEQLDERTA